MRISSIIRERHLLTHPFYTKWQKGKVPIESLREYARQYYHYEKALPDFLEAAIEHIPNPEAKEAVRRVLDDERTHPKPHVDLWLDFAEGLGLDRSDVEGSTPSPRTVNLVETYASLCAKGDEEGLGAIYAYESQVPEVAEAKADGLRRFYELNDPDVLKFFDLHTTLDIEHAKAIRAGFEDTERAREATHLALDAWWGMLDQFNQSARVLVDAKP